MNFLPTKCFVPQWHGASTFECMGGRHAPKKQTSSLVRLRKEVAITVGKIPPYVYGEHLSPVVGRLVLKNDTIDVHNNHSITPEILELHATPSTIYSLVTKEETIDNTVRKSMEIRAGTEGCQLVVTPEVLHALEKQWPHIEEMQAKFRKIVLYKAGCFVDEHRDAKLSDAHFGTLSVIIGGEYEGGELLVDGQQTGSDKVGSYCAFFTDVLHEVRPVTKGHRVCVIFELYGKVRRMSDSSGLKNALREYVLDATSPPGLVLSLERTYPLEHLHQSRLQGTDAILQSAVEQALLTNDNHVSPIYYELNYSQYHDESVFGCWLEHESMFENLPPDKEPEIRDVCHPNLLNPENVIFVGMRPDRFIKIGSSPFYDLYTQFTYYRHGAIVIDVEKTRSRLNHQLNDSENTKDMMEDDHLYYVTYVYERDGYPEVRLIGVFTSENLANQAKDRYIAELMMQHNNERMKYNRNHMFNVDKFISKKRGGDTVYNVEYTKELGDFTIVTLELSVVETEEEAQEKIRDSLVSARIRPVTVSDKLIFISRFVVSTFVFTRRLSERITELMVT